MVREVLEEGKEKRWRSNVDEERRWSVTVDAGDRGRIEDRAVGGED